MKKMMMLMMLAGAVSVAQAQDDARASASKVAAAPTAADLVPVKAKENSIALGVTMTDGNSDTLLTTASALHDRKREDYTLRLGVDFAYGKNDGEENNNNVKGVADYRYLVSERAYVFANLTALHDEIADINYRAVLSTGPGYYLMKNDRPPWAWKPVPPTSARKWATMKTTIWPCASASAMTASSAPPPSAGRRWSICPWWMTSMTTC
jgi:putative salt-induced outer membrane protein YdiY